jgi:hypothetical protein
MSANAYLNGTDYLMLGFDHELRRRGFAGNSCQIVLELGSPVSSSALQQRLAALQKHYPILCARRGGLVRPYWKLLQPSSPGPVVRVHRSEPGLNQRLCNDPLAVNRGELVRFDLIESDGDRATLIFTWAHALMDARGAENFLALVGREDLPLPAERAGSLLYEAPGHSKLRLAQRCKLAWKNLYLIDEFAKATPRSLGVRHGDAQACLRYRVEKFSSAETECVRANAVRHCGALGAVQFHAAAALLELHHLHQRLGSPSSSYVLPVPVGLRPKGTVEPLFGNQLTILMTQLLPDQLNSIASAVASLKTQTVHALRTGMIESSRQLSDLFRFVPLPLYMSILKQGLHGEICSLFYGDSAAVSPLLTSFMGAPVKDFIHVAAVTPSPGLGVIFYYFLGDLRVTVLHLATVLTEAEAFEFAAKLRARLLCP